MMVPLALILKTAWIHWISAIYVSKAAYFQLEQEVGLFFL